MTTLRKSIAAALFMTMLSQQAGYAAEGKVTKNRPVIEKNAPEREIPTIEESKVVTWVWWALAGTAAAIGGGVALSGGKSGGGSNPAPTTPAPANSGVNVTW